MRAQHDYFSVVLAQQVTSGPSSLIINTAVTVPRNFRNTATLSGPVSSTGVMVPFNCYMKSFIKLLRRYFEIP